LTFALSAERAAVDEVLGLSLAELLPVARGYDVMFDKWQGQQLSGQSFEIEVINGDASRLVLQSVLYARLEGETFNRLWLVLRDVTVHARAVQALARAELHFRTLVERPGMVLARLRPDGMYDYVSPSVESLLGVPPSQLISGGDVMSDRIHPDDHESHAAIRRARTERLTEPIESELRIRVKGGDYHWFLVRQFPKLFPNGDIEYFDVIAIDIQTRKDLEKNARLQSVERPLFTDSLKTAGLAHDLNNHLTALLGQLDAALSAIDPNSQVYTPINIARSAANACSQITRQLVIQGRDGSRSSSSDTSSARKEPVALSTLVPQTLTLASHLLPPGTKLSGLPVDSRAIVEGNPVQLQQVLLNLILNARDAMPEGGEIAVHTNICNARADADSLAPLQPGLFIRLDVKDSGTGMPASVRERIFDPLFTTKAEGRGTGLGLPMAKSIIEDHDGWIDLVSLEGQGTTFSVYLPLCSVESKASWPSAATPTVSSNVHASLGTNKQRSVVIIDDEEMVRRMLLSTLSKFGFDVVGVPDGDSLTQLMSKRDFPHDVIVLDDTMPKTRGVDLVPHIRATWPDAVIILTSGDGRVRSHPAFDPEQATFIEKPFTLEELVTLIGRCHRT